MPIFLPVLPCMKTVPAQAGQAFWIPLSGNHVYEHSARHRALAVAANDQQQQQQFGIVQHRLHHACCLSHLSHNSTRSSAGADATVGDRRL
uniref:Secreted protein n=1 Tax=Globodera pallida TaxID=36090 RepID=A0A183CQ59_GLOPA